MGAGGDLGGWFVSAVDHVDEATAYVHAAHAAAELESAEYELRQAQVHATLALVEQQRIANLQAFADGLADDMRRASTTEPHLLAALKKIGDEVAQGLGFGR